jgi:hypothetical protein
MMRHDCNVAGITYSASDGFADFHANRVLFITSLCRSNVGLVTAQKLARHSDPKLTSNVYSKVSPQERAEAVGGISFETTGFLGGYRGQQEGSSQTANGGNLGHIVTESEKCQIADGQKNDSRNPLKGNQLAQKKPLAGTSGLRVGDGIRTHDLWNHNPEL